MDRRRHLTWLKRVLVPTFLIALFIASATIAWASGLAEVRVNANDSTFDPATITVNVGDTVTWVIASTGAGPHDVTADNGAFSSPRRMMNGQTFSWTATAPGTYTYVCTVHARLNMRGTVVVQGAGGTGGAPAAPPRTGSGGMAGGQSPWFYLVLLVAGLGGSLGLLAGRRRARAEQPSN